MKLSSNQIRHFELYIFMDSFFVLVVVKLDTNRYKKHEIYSRLARFHVDYLIYLIQKISSGLA